MKKITVLLFALCSGFFLMAQDSPAPDPLGDTSVVVIDTLPITDPNDLIDETQEEKKQEINKMQMAQMGLAGRSRDHLLIQLGYTGWGNAPDSINTSGIPRSFNVYFMFDFPFKTNPKLSLAAGLGIGTNNMYFTDTDVDIIGRNANRVSFRDVSDTTHFKKYKLTTAYLELPVEFRYMKNPDRPNRSFKAAIGAKVGTLLSATTKGKNLLNSAGNSVNAYTLKEKSKRYFNRTRISLTGRVGMGALSLFGTYQVNSLFKEGFGPDIRPYTIGLTLSGL